MIETVLGRLIKPYLAGIMDNMGIVLAILQVFLVNKRQTLVDAWCLKNIKEPNWGLGASMFVGLNLLWMEEILHHRVYLIPQ